MKGSKKMHGGFTNIQSIILMAAVNITKKKLSKLNEKRRWYRGFRNYRGVEVLVRQNNTFTRGRIVGKPKPNETVDYNINTRDGWDLSDDNNYVDLTVSHSDIPTNLFLKEDYLLPGTRVGVMIPGRNVSDTIINFGIIQEVHKSGLVPKRQPKYTVSLDIGERILALEKNVMLESDFLPPEIASVISTMAVSDNEWINTLFRLHDDATVRLLRSFITMRLPLNDIQRFLRLLVSNDNNVQFMQLMLDNGYDLSAGNIDRQENVNIYGFGGVITETRIIDLAAGYGSTNTVRWLHNNGYNVTTDTLMSAHRNRRTQTVWWICNNTNVPAPIHEPIIQRICANRVPPTNGYYENEWR